MNSHFYTMQDSCIQFTSCERANRSLKRCFSLLFFVVFILLLGAFTGNAQTIVFTGDAEVDFSVEGVFVLDDTLDVGLPPGWPFPASGWDIKKAYFYTNLNQLHVGVEYYGIAGDADGDGDPNNSSQDLIARGGQDLPNLANTESIAVAFDLDQDGIFDIIAGVPGGDSDGGSLGCENYDINDCFGLYNYFPDVSIDQLAFRFLSLIEHPITNQNPSISAARPDFEFTIHDWNLISEWGGVEPNTCETFSFDVGLYSGSFQDDGIGEDTMPNNSNSETVSLEVCADCEGTIFGTQKVDSCGVCGGDNSTCGVKTINFTGDPEEDFIGDGVFLLSDSVDPNSTPIPDVGVPSQIGSVISGWDIKNVYFFTNIGELYIGVDYFGIAGDADGSNDPGVASPELESIGGQDHPDMAQSEALAIEIDIDKDGIFEFISGVPAGNPVGGDLGCPNFDLNDCFGLYNHSNNNSSNPGVNFESLIDPLDSLFALPSSDTPDIEYSIRDWQNLTGWDMPEPDSCETFSFDVRIFSGSFVDAGIGEDFMPNQLDTSTVSLDVCTDCDGIPFGPNVAGECGCGEEEVDENGNGILDCKEVELTVNLMGEGGGSVSSDPPRVDCPGDCSEIYEKGTVVTLRAVSDEVSQFAGWTGDPDCEDGVVTMDADKICEATFSFLSLKLNPIFPSVASNVNSMSVENASPNGAVAFIRGFGNEIANVTIDCGSIELGISPFQLLGIVNAGSDQMANLLFYIALGSYQNPMYTQAVDLNTCRVSNLVTNLIANN